MDKILEHPYFEKYHDKDNEPTNHRRMTPDQNFNAMSEIREYMYKLIDTIH